MARFSIAVLALAVACGGSARLPVDAVMGPNPQLTEPRHSTIPVVKVAKAEGWTANATPTVAEGLAVNRFADGLDHPRFLYVLPNGDVLVAETNGPAAPEDNPGGIRGWFMKRFFHEAGADVPSANRITLLRDADGDGRAEVKTVLIDSLSSPFGIAFAAGQLYIANADALVRVPYQLGDLRIASKPVKVTDLPGRPYNHHWTKSLLISADGKTAYVGVGSNSNVAEHGMEVEAERAAIWQIDLATGAHRVFASGLRNPAGLTWEPTTGTLWTSVNERDELGSDLVPDYMTSVRDGAFYGWPYSYYGNHVDERVKPQRPDMVARAIAPDYALGPHTASLGLASSKGETLGPLYANGMFVGQHGSWNRKPLSGYKVIFVPFQNGQPVGPAFDVLTDFVKDDVARGRPVGVVIDRRGTLLVADDVGNSVWRVTGKRP